MVMRNITTNKNCGNSNKLLHRFRNLVAIHSLPIAMVVRTITTQQHCGKNFKQYNTVLFCCKSTRQVQRQSILMQLNVIMAILLTNSNTFQVSPLATPNIKIAMHYFCGNTIPLLPPFQTNVLKHTPITTQFVVMQMVSSGNRVEIQKRYSGRLRLNLRKFQL